jgi:hypothetical protein
MVSQTSLINWVLSHDEKIGFIFFYIGLSLILSLALGLFWLLLIVFLHWVLELVVHSYKSNNFFFALGNSFWEIKLDIGLVLMALWLAVYLDFIFGIAGLGVAARSVAQIGNHTLRSGSRLAGTSSNIAKTTVRFAGWQRIIRSSLLSLDDLVQIFRGIFKAKDKKADIKESTKSCSYPAEKNQDSAINLWVGKWTNGDIASTAIIVVFASLLLMAPQMIGIPFDEVLQILIEELRPFST